MSCHLENVSWFISVSCISALTIPLYYICSNVKKTKEYYLIK